MTISLYLAGLPGFLAYFAVAIAMLLLFLGCYSWLTPHKEWQLIKADNKAAAVAFSGSIIGFVLPLHSALSNSTSLLDFMLWGLIAFVVQILTFFVLKGLLLAFKENLSKHISEDHLAFGILVAGLSISVGLLNAAAMTY